MNRGRRGLPEAGRVRRVWDEAAGPFDDFIETGLDYHRLEIHGPALLRACGDVKGLRVLDVGCGQGYFSRVLSERGAKVVGIDLSPKMIALAKRHEKVHPLGIQYRVMDASRIGRAWGPGSFDLVTACMSLHDMPSPGKVIRSASRILTKTGAMAFSVVHSVNNGSLKWETNPNGKRVATVDNYFRHGRYVVRWDMRRLKHHWSTVSYGFTVSDWSEMAEDSGFVMQSIREPRPTKNQIRIHPELEPCSRVPLFLVFKLQRAQDSPRVPKH
jgi:2-polyprenyl-3-methyl-5-hydroxy-6-metoxy-1,4-benzoquinol methylase